MNILSESFANIPGICLEYSFVCDSTRAQAAQLLQQCNWTRVSVSATQCNVQRLTLRARGTMPGAGRYPAHQLPLLLVPRRPPPPLADLPPGPVLAASAGCAFLAFPPAGEGWEEGGGVACSAGSSPASSSSPP